MDADATKPEDDLHRNENVTSDMEVPVGMDAGAAQTSVPEELAAPIDLALQLHSGLRWHI